jgi:hypothetical protein
MNTISKYPNEYYSPHPDLLTSGTVHPRLAVNPLIDSEDNIHTTYRDSDPHQNQPAEMAEIIPSRHIGPQEVDHQQMINVNSSFEYDDPSS